MTRPATVRARRLRIELWVCAPEDEALSAARTVAEGMGEGLGDAWYELTDGDPYAITFVWTPEYLGSTVDAVLDDGAILALTPAPEG